MIDGRSSRTYRADAQHIWQLITTTADISWRPGISAVSADGALTHRETNRRTGHTTKYTITNDEPNVRRDMTVEHADGAGSFSFALTAHTDRSTTVEINQQFTFNGPRLIQPLVSRFLRAERRTFLADLGRALS